MKRQNSEAVEAEILKKYDKKAKAKGKKMKVSGAAVKKLAKLIKSKPAGGLKTLALAAVAGAFLWAGPAAAEEAVLNYEVKLAVLADGRVRIEEAVEYDFDTASRHGIYRDIPFAYSARGGKFKLRLSDITVTDTQGNPYIFTVDDSGGNKRIKIGDPATTVTGKQTYLVRYTVARAINYFADHDELYWNAVGSGWTVPIRQAKVELALPALVNEADLKAECWAGPAGTDGACVSKRYDYSGPGTVSGVVFAHDRVDPGEDLTLAVGWPKGLVAEPGLWDKFRDLARDNGIVVLPILAIVLLYWLWRRHGRDPAGRGTIIAQYEAPGGLTPAEVGAAYDERVDERDISAEIIGLAVAGYLTIERLSGEGIFNTADYKLAKQKDAAPGLPEHQRLLMAGLFKDSNEVKISELKEKFHQSWEGIKSPLYRQMVLKKVFAKNPRAVRTGYYAAGAVLLGLSLFVMPVFGPIGTASCALAALAVLVFARYMPARTKAGAIVREEILGLREYLKVAEKDRLEFHNAPEKNPALFERLLPYAMVLKVEEEWAKQFEGLYQAKPAWYRDANYQNFNALALASHLNGFSSKSMSSLSSRPSSAAGGRSGFSGGRSGGGFGGGGGGSW